MAKKAKWKYDLPTEGIIPIWTDEPPTEPGLYWWRLHTESSVVFDTRVRLNETGQLTVDTKMGPIEVKNISRFWAGPLLEPKDE